MSVRASVLIPCHDKSATLPLTVGTVLRQTVHDLEVILIGDGVTEDVRRVATDLVAADARVRFLDLPKGPHHGEAYRHQAILAAGSEAIFYLCDDDLLLPDHVADLLALLGSANFVQSLNGYVRPDGEVYAYAGDLGVPRFVEELLSDRVRFNFVSITGTAHSREFYLATGRPWETTPEGQWPDHHQWRRMLAHPAFRGATSSRMTALQFPTSADGRDAWSEADRLAELERWHGSVLAPGAQARVDAALGGALWVQLADAQFTVARLWTDLEGARAALEQRDAELGRLAVAVAGLREGNRDLEAQVVGLRDRNRDLGEQVGALLASRSWRLTAPGRWIGTLLRRGLRGRAERRGDDAR